MWRVSNKSKILELRESCLFEKITCRKNTYKLVVHSRNDSIDVMTMSKSDTQEVLCNFSSTGQNQRKTSKEMTPPWTSSPSSLPPLATVATVAVATCVRTRSCVKKAFYSWIHEHWSWSSLLLNKQFRKISNIVYHQYS